VAAARAGGGGTGISCTPLSGIASNAASYALSPPHRKQALPINP